MIIFGDCLDQLKNLSPNSVDSLITDPPAGIAFMGNEWDKDKGGRTQWITWMTEVMKECLRVLKPGAHGLVWAIPRTSHWTATALEDAGFEVRDVVTHLFGSGFPKSLDISKAIDKAAGAEREIVGYRNESGPDFSDPQFIEQGSMMRATDAKRTQIPITEPSTSEAKQWQGWGTSLKPASERWILVKKPNIYDLDVSNKLIGELLCRMSSARFAAKVSTLNQADSQSAQTQDFAQWLVDALTILSSTEQSELMDMFSSPEMGLTFLNIGLLWSGILDVLSSHGNMFTTETKTSLTIELKTLNSFLSMTIQESIILEEMIQSGQEPSVGTATRLLSASYQRLRSILTLIVQSSATMPAGSKASLIQNLQQHETVIQTAPSSEDYILIRKPLSEKTVAANVLKHGTGGINIDASRIDGKPRATHGDRNIRTQDNLNGRYNGGMPLGEYPVATGRFPANLILSHNPDCVEVGTKKVGSGKSGLVEYSRPDIKGNNFNRADKKQKSMGMAYGTETVAAWECTEGCEIAELDKQSSKLTSNDSGGASRFFYCAKASKKDKGVDNTHPTVKSSTLMSYLIKMITPPHGIVLDPFMGSGSTGVAAFSNEFKFIGIEKEAQYILIAHSRIYQVFLK